MKSITGQIHNQIKNWELIRFCEENYLQTATLLFAGIVFTYSLRNSDIEAATRVTIPWVLLALVATKNTNIKLPLLGLTTWMLGHSAISHYNTLANHGFVIFYLAAAFFIVYIAKQEDRENLLRRFAFFMLSALMGIALIQKILSPYYMNGTFMFDFVGRGLMYDGILRRIYENWDSVIHFNSDARTEAARANLEQEQTHALMIPYGTKTLTLVLTYSSLTIQLLLEIATFFHSKLKYWFHFSLLIFIAVIYSTVNENIFLSLNCLLGYLLTNDATKKARPLYIMLAFYLLTMYLTGLRPPVL